MHGFKECINILFHWFSLDSDNAFLIIYLIMLKNKKSFLFENHIILWTECFWKKQYKKLEKSDKKAFALMMILL